MKHRYVVLPALAIVAGGFAALGACSTGELAQPAAPDSGAMAVENDAAVEVPQPTCTIQDIPAGKGQPFCDLPGTDVPYLTVPEGFCVREYTTTPIKEARVLAFAPNGDLFVAAPAVYTVGGAGDGPGAIEVLPDDDHDGRADAVLHFAGPSLADGRGCNLLEAEDPASLACVHGLVFSDGYLYYTRSDEVRRFTYTPGQRAASTPVGELVATLGSAAIPDARFAHTLERTKEGTILVSRGRHDTSACSAEEMTRGAVMALHMELAPTLPVTPEIIADGFRNPMYLRCSPSSCGDCYASELSGDDWDGVGGREKLALLSKKGENWGYPCCVGHSEPHPRNGAFDCENVGAELVSIPLHDTNFGLDFDRGGFPEPYKHGVFIALHGAFTSHGGSGVIWMPTHPKSLRPTGKATMFVNGFGTAGNGRATDAVFAPDGRLFIADDTTGRIYWVAPRTLRAPQ